LEVVEIGGAKAHALSVKGQEVTGFAVRDVGHYAYTVASLQKFLPRPWGGGHIAWDGTGQSLVGILLPRELKPRYILGANELRSVLWAAVDGAPHQVLDGIGKPIVLYPDWGGSLALSADGYTLATPLPVPDVPRWWGREFLPAEKSGRRMHVGFQDLDAGQGDSLTMEYVLVDLRNGAITAVNGAPTGSANGWYQTGGLTWSDDGAALLLPDAYLRSSGAKRAVARPCVAIFQALRSAMHCLDPLKSLTGKDGAPERGFFYIEALRFVDSSSDRVLMRYMRINGSNEFEEAAETFGRGDDGEWHDLGSVSGDDRREQNGVRIDIVQGLNTPPVVVAKEPDGSGARVIWDPNPQLKGIALGKATIYHWKDATAREWTGGLYEPVNYVTGRRYPLVVQTHGFEKNAFRPSGLFSTAMAARALAARGIIVLQVASCPILIGPQEGPCEVAGYDAAVRQLAAQGVIDPRRVGVIGFSYTVYTVLQALTSSSTQFAAASITDGLSYGYWEYLTNADKDGSSQEDAMVGARPFGTGLRLWLSRAPDFNLQKVHTPLLVTSSGRVSLVTSMWEPYAALWSLNKPVDLVVLDSGEHVLTEPAARMASQGGAVDWFRFWLEGYESPRPIMPGEYARWEQLCDEQREQNPGRRAWCMPTAHYRARHRDVIQSLVGSRQ
jgi:hypothetical protein